MSAISSKEVKTISEPCTQLVPVHAPKPPIEQLDFFAMVQQIVAERDLHHDFLNPYAGMTEAQQNKAVIKKRLERLEKSVSDLEKRVNDLKNSKA